MTVLVCFAGLALVEGIVPPWAPWVVIWTLATTGAGPRSLDARVRGRDRRDRRGPRRPPRSCTHGRVVSCSVAAVTSVVALLGVLVRSERSRVEEAGRRATVEERLRIARDLHDLVGHGLSAVAVQSSTARMAIAAGDTATAERALAAVETSSRTAMREMRQMLHLLTDEVGVEVATATPVGPAVGGDGPATDPDPARPPVTGGGRHSTLVDNVRAGGVVGQPRG